jgi:hypothetical protein
MSLVTRKIRHFPGIVECYCLAAKECDYGEADQPVRTTGWPAGCRVTEVKGYSRL